MLYNSNEWKEKLAMARRAASSHNERMALIGRQQYGVGGGTYWHYTIVAARVAHRLRRRVS